MCTLSQYVTCDDCGKRLDDFVPFALTHKVNNGPREPELWTKTFDVCSTACLVRLAAALHRPPTTPAELGE